MISTLNAKFGVAALVAALVVAFGAFGLSATTTSAVPSPPIVVTPSGTVSSGTEVTIQANFTQATNTLTVSADTTGGASVGDFELVSATLFTTILPNGLDVTPIAINDDTSGDTYLQLGGPNQTLDQYPDQGPALTSVAYVLKTTISCPTTGGTVTIVSNQAGLGITERESAAITCTIPSPSVLSVKKVDQLGALRSATFQIQQQTAAGWVTIATMITSATSAASNPCLSTSPCTNNPSVVSAGVLPPSSTGGVVLPTGVNLQLVEVAQPTNCTLVAINKGDGSIVSNGLAPYAFTLPAANANDVKLTFTNSCQTPLGPNAANSGVTAVIGGATFGLSNTTHVEIVPAPGSDDDARLDIRARDVNNVVIPDAHVTVSIDKGVLAMRTDTAGATPVGYEVIEPGTYGSSTAGDTCDQTIGQFNANPFNGANTNPFISASPTIQDGYTNINGLISACVYVNPDLAPTITPGKINVTVIIETPQNALYAYGATNIILTTSITVVGPPASIKVAASPTNVQCGEKSTITATVTDSVGQNVSDHTRVELISNYGSTIGGTGATLGFPGVGPVNPLSSSAAETFSGVATAFLLTSTEHVGPYEVVVASGGSVGGALVGGNVTYQTGAFSTAPVSAQVTVTCALPVVSAPVAPVTPPITAPRTGEGIRPPNTGDAGLAAGNSSWAFVLAGAVAFALAGVASVKFARR